MRRNVPCGRHAYVAANALKFATPNVLVIALAFSLFVVIPSGAARQVDPGFSPASGPAQVIAPGVVALPEAGPAWFG